MTTPPNTFKRPKARQRTPPAKSVPISEEARKKYEDTMREMDERERHRQHLPEEHKGRR